MEGTLGLFAGAVGLGLLHGIEPGHGWPVAAGWASARRRPWQAGVLAAVVIGLGHLLSSIAVVGLFFAAKSWLDFGDSRWLVRNGASGASGRFRWSTTEGHRQRNGFFNNLPGCPSGVAVRLRGSETRTRFQPLSRPTKVAPT